MLTKAPKDLRSHAHHLLALATLYGETSLERLAEALQHSQMAEGGRIEWIAQTASELGSMSLPSGPRGSRSRVHPPVAVAIPGLAC